MESLGSQKNVMSSALFIRSAPQVKIFHPQSGNNSVEVKEKTVREVLLEKISLKRLLAASA